MITRALMLVWILSLCWLGLVVRGFFYQDMSISFLVALGWPSALGLSVVYLFTGSFFLPKK